MSADGTEERIPRNDIRSDDYGGPDGLDPSRGCLLGAALGLGVWLVVAAAVALGRAVPWPWAARA